jgi:hypothetical protein
MKGTILDFLNLANEKPELAKELVELAGRYDFAFTDELSEQDLDEVAGGTHKVSRPPLEILDRSPSELYSSSLGDEAASMPGAGTISSSPRQGSGTSASDVKSEGGNI